MAPCRQQVSALWPTLHRPSHRLPSCSKHVLTGKPPAPAQQQPSLASSRRLGMDQLRSSCAQAATAACSLLV